MLAVGQRLRRREEFSTAIRTGRRSGRGALVVHVTEPTADRTPAARGARAGFVVARTVGSAVVRNRVRRRLRHLVRERLDALPAGTDLVVRALPAAADRTYQQLGDDLDAALAATRTGSRRHGGTRKGVRGE